MDKRTFKILAVLFASAATISTSSAVANPYCRQTGDWIICYTPTHTCYMYQNEHVICEPFNDG